MLMFYKNNWRVRKAWISSSAMKRLEQKSSPFWKLNEWKQFKILTFFGLETCCERNAKEKDPTGQSMQLKNATWSAGYFVSSWTFLKW